MYLSWASLASSKCIAESCKIASCWLILSHPIADLSGILGKTITFLSQFFLFRDNSSSNKLTIKIVFS